MKNVLYWAGRGFMWLCTAGVVLAGVAYLAGRVAGIPVRVTYQTVDWVRLPDGRTPPPSRPEDTVRRGRPHIPSPGSSAVARPAPPDTTSGAMLSASKAQNVVFFVGDGMGLSMLSTVDALAEHRLAMGQMPVTGLVRVASLTSLITDSGASATAMATGYKTTNGTIAMTPNGQARQTILEAAEGQGFATGIVTTSYLTDATAAAFTAHTPSRGNHGVIAQQMIASGTDILLGGAQKVFTDRLQRARQQGLAVGTSLRELQNAPASARWLGLFPERDGPFEEMHGPPLAQTVEAALQKLQQRAERFFLVVEQEGTDAAGHTNRLEDARAYLQELDRAVERALRFAAHQGNTLVIVTADHDSGGLSVTRGRYDEGWVTARWNKFGHTAVWTPLLAYGPGAWRFTGVQENTALPVTMARLLGLDGFLESFPEPWEKAMP